MVLEKLLFVRSEAASNRLQAKVVKYTWASISCCRLPAAVHVMPAEGKGDFSDPEYQERLKGVGVHGATHTGGDPIEMGGPTGKGSKTTFTTLG